MRDNPPVEYRRLPPYAVAPDNVLGLLAANEDFAALCFGGKCNLSNKLETSGW